MRLIRQRRANDCGVAVVAMVCGVSYARALAAFSFHVQYRMRALKSGTTTRDVAEAIERLGWRCDRRCRPIRKRDLWQKNITGRAILAVRFPEQGRTEWHWIAYDAQGEGDRRDSRYHDPSTQIHPYVVTGYIRVWRDE